MLAGQTFGGAVVDQRLQGVLDDRFGERTGRVVGAGGAALGSRGDIDAAGGDDGGAAVVVVADEAGEGQHAGVERCVVAAGGAELRGAEGVRDSGEGLAQRALGAAGLFAQIGE